MSSRLRATVLLAVLLFSPAAAKAQPATGAGSTTAASRTAPAGPEAIPLRTPQGGETPDQGIKALVKDIFGDFAHLPSMSNLPPAAAGTAATLLAHSFDDDVNSHFAGSEAVDDFYAPGKLIGNGGIQIAAAAAIYAIGRTTDRPRVTSVGMDLVRAQAVAGALTLALKEIVRRERPDGSGHGSFPSGHASVTFATATVLASHFSLRISIPMYLLAVYVSTSRLHENVHWLSDVVAGGTLGYVVGRTVTRHGRENFALVPFVQPHGGGLVLTRAW